MLPVFMAFSPLVLYILGLEVQPLFLSIQPLMPHKRLHPGMEELCSELSGSPSACPPGALNCWTLCQRRPKVGVLWETQSSGARMVL